MIRQRQCIRYRLRTRTASMGVGWRLPSGSGWRAIKSVSLWRITSNGPCCSNEMSKFSCQHSS